MMTPSTRAIGVMGKPPVPGTVKTRLIPPLDERQAAQLYGVFLRDTLLTALSVGNARVSLFHSPAKDLSTLNDLLPAEVARVEETGSDLGESMHQAVRHSLMGGADSVVVIGSDLPTLPARMIEEAFAVLERGTNDLVLGPSADGGYYLIGLRAPQPALFEDMRWSTDDVLAETLERSRCAGLRAALLETRHDIDSPADLERLWRELDRAPGSIVATTRTIMSAIRQQGPEFGKSAHGTAHGNTIR